MCKEDDSAHGKSIIDGSAVSPSGMPPYRPLHMLPLMLSSPPFVKVSQTGLNFYKDNDTRQNALNQIPDFLLITHSILIIPSIGMPFNIIALAIKHTNDR
jgi:hydrogenase maturation factor HypF (carbamoyltransferase family)